MAARVDAPFDLEMEEAGGRVFGAETGGGVGDGMTATAAGAGVMLAAWQVAGGARVDGWCVHGDPQKGIVPKRERWEAQGGKGRFGGSGSQKSRCVITRE